MNRNKQLSNNQIRIGSETQLQHATRFALSLFTEGHTVVDLAAIGVSIGKLVVMVEHLKIEIPGLYQQYFIGSKNFGEGDGRSLPYMKVSLRLQDNFGKYSKGIISDPLPENKRKRLYNFQVKMAKERINQTYSRRNQSYNEEERRYTAEERPKRVPRGPYITNDQPQKRIETYQRTNKPFRKPIRRLQQRQNNNRPRYINRNDIRYDNNPMQYDNRNERYDQGPRRNNYITATSKRNQNFEDKIFQEKMRREEQGNQPIREKPQSNNYAQRSNNNAIMIPRYQNTSQRGYFIPQAPNTSNYQIRETRGGYRNNNINRGNYQSNQAKYFENNRGEKIRRNQPYANDRLKGNRNNYNMRRDEYIESDEDDYEEKNYRQPKMIGRQEFQHQHQPQYYNENRPRFSNNEFVSNRRNNQEFRGSRRGQGSRGIRRGGFRQNEIYY